MTQPVKRRTVMAGAMNILAAAAMAPLAWIAPARAKQGPITKGNAMNVVCQIRYQLDPFKRAQFEEYAKVWLKVIPECGGDLIGYFMPHEGTNDVAWGIITLDSLAAYEAYKAKLKDDADLTREDAVVAEKRLILREERNFVRLVKGTFNVPPAG